MRVWHASVALKTVQDRVVCAEETPGQMCAQRMLNDVCKSLPFSINLVTFNHTVLESDHGDVEAACYSCCSVGPDPTVGGQHHHLHPTRQGTCTGEGGL